MNFNFVLVFFCAYLLGSIPTSYLMGKIIKGIDIRQFGSGNVGASNALRVLGTKVGITTLLIDTAKGFFAVYLGNILLQNHSILILISIGLFAIIGHIFTIFLKFKGGKGVATSTGVFIALAPIPVLISLSVFLLAVIISKYISLGSILAALAFFITELIINIHNSFDSIELLIFAFVITLFIIVRHKSNIKRIIDGNENKISFKSRRN
ncbi:MAG: glycerol-3-phosphate 1-O-acyltransferase PlsY [Candidatus Cloacimonetes bacterium]|nr:glycerol-3-phosphate 1-O-acyltransferase PlsY [Candidatus Cloacimonadota bacterium]